MDKEVDIKKLIGRAFDKTLESQYPVAHHMVESRHAKKQNESPAEAIAYLKKLYRGSIGVSGFAAGAAAAVPNGAGQVTVAVSDICNFLESSVLYVFSVATVYGMDLSSEDLRRFLALIVLIGDSGSSTVTKALGGRTVHYWSKKVIEKIPMSSIQAVNKVLGPRFLTKYGTKQGIATLGKQLPFMIGAGVGAVSNEAFGELSIKAIEKFLGPVPETWPDSDSSKD
ncbi:EcsC family protein [Bifidobacterium sp. ESL0728]|uniref:EcsC family protein n=1 Tax=Bifidobacterium sp. ESL0728 TaxID=2983220 RepID=UPI0023FA32B8|nr:EcsC family protein [Bifidobacterium sp. ESL0728]WEV59767.1 EcsC family protein [Bifidobacterium sp. ESL0728]